MSRGPPPPLAIVVGDLAVCKGDSRRGTGKDVRHTDDEEGDEKSGAEQRGGETGARMEVGRHGNFFELRTWTGLVRTML